MAGTADTSDGGKDPLSDQVLDIPETESGELIQEFHDLYLRTGDTEYLDNAICLIEELVSSAPSDKLRERYQSLLNRLMETRNDVPAWHGQTEGRDVPSDSFQDIAVSNVPQGGAPKHISEVLVNLEETGQLVDTPLIATSDTGHPSSAIAKKVGLLTSDEDPPSKDITNGRALATEHHLYANVDGRLGDEYVEGDEHGEGALEDFRETAELVDQFKNMYLATKDIDHLYNATGLAQDLALKDKRALPLLNNLLETQDAGVVGQELTHLETTDDEELSEYNGGVLGKLPTATLCLDETSQETFERILKLIEVYTETREREHLDNAIRQAEELAITDKGIMPVLGQMLRMRNAESRTRGILGLHSPGRESGLEAFPASFTLQIDTTSQESLDLIMNFLNSYMRYNDIDYLNSAVGLAKELVPQDSGVQPLLDHMSKLQKEHRGMSKNFEEVQEAQRDDNPLVSTQAENPLSEGTLCGFLKDGRTREEKEDLKGDLYEVSWTTGQTEHLDRAIEKGKEMLAAASLERENTNNHIKAQLSHNLGNLYRKRYELQGTPEDCDMAIKLVEEAATATPSSSLPRSVMLTNLIGMLRMRYLNRGAVEDLDQAVKWAGEAHKLTPANTPYRAEAANRMGILLQMRYERLRVMEDLKLAIERMEEAAAATPSAPNDTSRAAIIDNVAQLLVQKYKGSGAVEDLDRSIELSKEAISTVPDGHPHHAIMSSNLSATLQTRFRCLRDAKDLDQAVAWINKAVAAVPPHSRPNAVMANNMSTAHALRSERFGDVESLEQAMKWGQEAVAASVAEDTDTAKAQRFMNMGLAPFLRYEQFGALEDLDTAIEWTQKGIAAVPPNDPARVGILSNMCKQLEARFLCSSDPRDLEQAIKYAQEAVAATPPDSPNRPEVCQNLGAMLSSKHNRLGDPEDLEQAIKWVQEALTAAPFNHPARPGMSQALGSFLLSRFDRFGDLEDLGQAVEWTEQAAAAIPLDDPARGRLYEALSTALRSRFSYLGDLRDIEQAIKWGEEAAKATPRTSAGWANVAQGLAQVLLEKYKRLGTSEDVEHAIKWAEKALAATPAEGPGRAGICGILSSIFLTKYGRLEALEDIEEAIMWAKQAAITMPPDHPERPKLLSNFSSKLLVRANRLKGSEDLEEAIRCAEEALELTPTDHSTRIGMTSRLASALGKRYKVSGALEDLKRALEYSTEAVTGMPSTGSYESRFHIYSDFCALLEARYLRFGAIEDLEQAIKYINNAVAAVPLDHPDRAGMLLEQSSIISRRYTKTNTSQDFYHLLHISYDAWSCHMSQPNNRIIAAQNAARLLVDRKKWQESSAILESAVKMLSKLSSSSFARGDQEYLLSDFSQLAAKTVSVAFQAGEEAAHCLRLLEFGRGVILGLVIDRRSDLSELRLAHPEVFEKYHRLRTEVDLSLVQTDGEDSVPTYQQRRRRREQVNNELEEVLVSIRELSGFEGFQLPPRSKELMAIADQGPIVIVNSTDIRSDAIIVTSSDIQLLPLPKLFNDSVQERMGQISRLVRGRRKTFPWRNERMEDILLWLWDVAVEPVLKALKLGTANGDLPHIWWIGVGPLAMAPFHAAGDHSKGSTRNTISQAISSYIPTIKALSYARQKKLELLERPDSRLLLVNMPTTPGHKALRSATEEIENITKIARGKTAITRLTHPSAAEVLAKLPSCHAVHFSCHGLSNSKNPSASHLLLQRGGRLDKLSVETISNTNIEYAQIAFLSACSTAENASHSLPDESIYIASGFQLAGFSHVLATQWISNDAACRKVAGDFYASLFSNTTGAVDGNDGGHRKVSAAFHDAVKKLRSENPRQPLLWAPFIHTGA